MSTELTLRPVTPDDLPAVAELHLAARHGAGDAFPPSVHPDHEARAWVAGWDLAAYDVWVADRGGEPARARAEAAPESIAEQIQVSELEAPVAMRPRPSFTSFVRMLVAYSRQYAIDCSYNSRITR